MEENNQAKHTVVMDKRERITLTGVLDVISFNEESIVADTDRGVLFLRGYNLHINRVDLDKGELDADGEIFSLVYEDIGKCGKGKTTLFGKIFK